jgi:hypothetical protein
MIAASAPSYRDMAVRYSVPKSALWRHRCEHLPARLVRVAGVKEMLENDDLLGQARTIQQQAFILLGKTTQPVERPCEKCGTPYKTVASVSKAIAAMRNAREGIRLLGEVLGRLQPRPAGNVTNNIVVVTRYELPTNGREAPSAAPPIPRGALPPGVEVAINGDGR